MFVYSVCSGGAAVYTEYVMKTRFPNESIHLQNVKFCLCGFFANFLVILMRGRTPFGNLELIHVLSILALTINGLTTSAVIKFAGSIVKTYAVSCSAFVSAILTYYFFGQTLQWNFYVGAIICFIAVNIKAFL